MLDLFPVRLREKNGTTGQMLIVVRVYGKDAHSIVHEVEEAEHRAARLELLEGARIELVELARGEAIFGTGGSALEGVIEVKVIAPGKEGGGDCISELAGSEAGLVRVAGEKVVIFTAVGNMNTQHKRSIGRYSRVKFVPGALCQRRGGDECSDEEGRGVLDHFDMYLGM